MVIAGGGPPRSPAPGTLRGFNGAGDGDRRRGGVNLGLFIGLGEASTEPAMVIAGGRSIVRSRYIDSGSPLQRSRRW